MKTNPNNITNFITNPFTLPTFQIITAAVWILDRSTPPPVGTIGQWIDTSTWIDANIWMD